LRGYSFTSRKGEIDKVILAIKSVVEIQAIRDALQSDGKGTNHSRLNTI